MTLVTLSGSVDMRAPGIYTLTYTSSDGRGNSSSATRAVTVVDTTPPAITLLGSNPLILEAATPYVEPGATVSDNAAGAVNLLINAAVVPAVPGNYSATYTATDVKGNIGTATRVIHVVDTTAPAVGGVFSPLALLTGEGGTAPLPDYLPQAVSTDAIGVVHVSQDPPAGSARAAGLTRVTIRSTDAAGNTGTTQFDVAVSDGTKPGVDPPATGFDPLTLAVGLDGTATLPNYLTQAVTRDNLAVTALTQTPPAGAALTPGVTELAITAADAAGNSQTFTFNVSVIDPIAPTISAPEDGFTPLSVAAVSNGSAILPDYTAQAVVSDNVAVISVTQEPPPGSAQAFGQQFVTLTARDAAGNTDELNFGVFISLPEPLVTSVASTGDAVPAAGNDPRIPAGAKFTTFGLPAIDGSRNVAFAAKWKADAVAGCGIFTGAFPSLLVAAGEDAPGVAGARFKKFEDPLSTPSGEVIFAATIVGGGVTGANDRGYWISSPEGLSLLLREGMPIPGSNALLIVKTILSVSARDGELVASAKLGSMPGVVGRASDAVLLRVTRTKATILAREGAYFGADAGTSPTYLGGLQSLLPAKGSAGHGRWHSDGGVAARIIVDGNRPALARLSAEGGLQRYLAVGDPGPDPGTSWTTVSLPALAGDGSMAVKGSLKAAAKGAKDSTVLAIAESPTAGFSVFARSGGSAPDGSIFASFLDPVLNDRSEVVFAATLASPGVTASSAALLYGTPADLEILARAGSPAPDGQGAPTSAVWKQFVSYALADGPSAFPLFVAKVGGRGVTARNNLGVWALDSSGSLRCLLRTGDMIEGKTAVAIHALAGAIGTSGATRGFNARGSVVSRVAYKGGAGIVILDVPDGGDYTHAGGGQP
jgi:hypothetical protein